jgi:hypothetical protein
MKGKSTSHAGENPALDLKQHLFDVVLQGCCGELPTCSLFPDSVSVFSPCRRGLATKDARICHSRPVRPSDFYFCCAKTV